MAKTEETAVTTTAPSGYLALAQPDLQVALRENLGQGGVDVLDMPRLRVPAGGGLAWTVPTIEGPKPREEVIGVLMHWTPVRAMWLKDLGTGGNTPPDCTSRDGETGIGDPGGDCATCPLNAFGSAKGGSQTGKACREARGILFLPEGEYLPFYLPAPVMSIKPIKDYFMRLSSQAKPYWAVVTRLKLAQAQNASGITYSKIEPTFVRELTPEERAAISGYRDSILPAFNATVSLTAADVTGGG